MRGLVAKKEKLLSEWVAGEKFGDNVDFICVEVQGSGIDGDAIFSCVDSPEDYYRVLWTEGVGITDIYRVEPYSITVARWRKK